MDLDHARVGRRDTFVDRVDQWVSPLSCFLRFLQSNVRFPRRRYRTDALALPDQHSVACRRLDKCGPERDDRRAPQAKTK